MNPTILFRAVGKTTHSEVLKQKIQIALETLLQAIQSDLYVAEWIVVPIAKRIGL